MKSTKTITIIAIVTLLAISWVSIFSSAIKQFAVLSDLTSKAEQSVELGLYEQAIEYYNDALKERKSKKYYNRMKEIYDVFYKEEKTSYVRTHFIDDMLSATDAYPKEELYWNTVIRLYMDNKEYRDAYSTAKKALNMGASDEQLDKYYKELMYMEKVEYKVYSDVFTALNGYNTVSTGSQWYVINDKGEEVTEQYAYVGLINDEGHGIYNTGKEVRLLDKDQIVRSRFGELKIDEAGYYSESSQCFPARVGEKWVYVRKDGSKLKGEFDVAGSFYNGEAVVCSDGKWSIINDDGNLKELDKFSDIKLDLYGCHIQGDVIIAKENNKYHLYDKEFKQIGKFECDDIDICINNNLIAFKSGSKWGFVDTSGKVIVEPKYTQAKSFSNKYAAVCGDNGLWGFVNDKYELVIGNKYMDAYYFTPGESCFISKDEGTYQLMRFMFE